MPHPTFSRLRDDITHLPATLVLVHTDGQGRLIDVFAPAPERAEEISGGLDLMVGAVAELGRRRGLGALQTALLSFASGHVVVGALPGDETIAVVASSEANVGLLFSHVRRALSGEVAP